MMFNFRMILLWIMFNCGWLRLLWLWPALTDGRGKSHPGTNVTLIDLYDGFSSLVPLSTQSARIAPQVEAVIRGNPGGIHVIGYSQGGLLARGIIENITNHNIINFISLSSPQGGQYGDTRIFRYLFPFYLKEELYRIFYTYYGQDISVANYWNDPHHQDLYTNYSDFLAVVNNQRLTNSSKEFKSSFSRLKNVVLIGGPSDRIITPWQSSQFAAYNKSEVILPMTAQEWYTADLFGLRTLDKRKAIHTYTVDGVVHEMWHRNKTVYDHCIEPWLT